MKRLAALLGALMMILSCAKAELKWPPLTTDGQNAMKSYVERVNANLAAQGLAPVNSIFECYAGFATMGATALDQAEIAENMEMTFTLDNTRLLTLQLRLNDSALFTAAAAACLQAAVPDSLALQDAKAEPSVYVERILRAPYTAFEDEVDPTPGSALRAYWAYYPDQYSDGVNWLQMTLVFPLAGSSASVVLTPVPDTGAAADEDVMYGDNTVFDEDYEKFSHLDIVLTPTPEPDSPAME